MTDSPMVAFLWSDAWLLLAVGLAAQTGPAELAAVVEMGDAIEHAIFTKEELDGGIGRLQRAGYVDYTPAGLAPTQRGQAVLEQAARVGTTLSAQQRALEMQLGASAWSPSYTPRYAQGSEGELVSTEAYDRAVGRSRR